MFGRGFDSRRLHLEYTIKQLYEQIIVHTAVFALFTIPSNLEKV